MARHLPGSEIFVTCGMVQSVDHILFNNPVKNSCGVFCVTILIQWRFQEIEESLLNFFLAREADCN
jgi:hypothetical protein